MPTPPGAGGGMLCVSSSIKVIDCVFIRNEAWRGGGASCEDGAPTFVNCTFSCNNLGNGAGLHCSFTAPTLISCVFTENTSTGFGGGIWCNYSSPQMTNCTLFGNRADAGGGGMYCYAFCTPVIENTIIAYSTAGGALVCEPQYNDPYLSCCDLYENTGGDWAGAIANQGSLNGNFSACPSFCNAEAGNLHLCDESPCAPGNHPDGYDCGLVGALDVGCSCGPTGSEPTTWGAIKAMLR
jgi:predicted outer membrane repeat protein